MWLLSPPSSERVGLFLAEQRGLDFSYPEMGHSLESKQAMQNAVAEAGRQ